MKSQGFMNGAKKRSSIFDHDSDQVILDKMKEYEEKKIRSPFVEIAKLIPYDQRQICNRWRNYLNPKLCHKPLKEKEKQFINKWILKIEPSAKTKPKIDKQLKREDYSGKIIKRSKHKKYEKRIDWKILRLDLEKECGFLRSENILKNYWYPNLRRTKEEEQGEDDDLDVMQEDVEESKNMIVSSPCGDPVSSNELNNMTCITTMLPPHNASRSFSLPPISLPPISSILNNPSQPQRSRTLPDYSTQSRTLPPISSILNNPPQNFILPPTSFTSIEPSCLCDYSTQNRPRLPPISSILDMPPYDSSVYQRQNRYLEPLYR
ncbi:hypothetical protein RclHR1_05530012 [Rhizophagus clarus]|nr:hypothetical protein RclHR1_05530012 [Rhizophagus clarus]